VARAPAIDLRELRVNRGLSIEAAALEMEIETATLRRAELGVSKPQARNAFRIAQFYGLKVTDIWPLQKQGVSAA
jgi:transcriptional regulator with XRE-family HTH domain